MLGEAHRVMVRSAADGGLPVFELRWPAATSYATCPGMNTLRVWGGGIFLPDAPRPTVELIHVESWTPEEVSACNLHNKQRSSTIRVTSSALWSLGLASVRVIVTFGFSCSQDMAGSALDADVRNPC